jgi:hypothetical protein
LATVRMYLSDWIRFRLRLRYAIDYRYLDMWSNCTVILKKVVVSIYKFFNCFFDYFYHEITNFLTLWSYFLNRYKNLIILHRYFYAECVLQALESVTNFFICQI